MSATPSDLSYSLVEAIQYIKKKGPVTVHYSLARQEVTPGRRRPYRRRRKHLKVPVIAPFDCFRRSIYKEQATLVLRFITEKYMIVRVAESGDNLDI